MKTPTLIVRLIGLYLFAKSLFALVEIQSLPTPLAGVIGPQGTLISQINLISWACMLFGAYVSIRAGGVARWLTFDAAPTNRSRDLSDLLLDKSRGSSAPDKDSEKLP